MGRGHHNGVRPGDHAKYRGWRWKKVIGLHAEEVVTWAPER